MKNSLKSIDTFVERLKKIGIMVEIHGNFPWIYLRKINGKRVTELFNGNHGFTIAFLPVKPEYPLRFTNISKIFKLIRKYINNEKSKF